MNKTFLTVAQVFVAITGAILIIYGLIFVAIFNFAPVEAPLGIISIIFFVIAALYAFVFIRFGQAKTNSLMKTEVIVYSVLLLITSNIFAGIFGLIGAITEPSNQVQTGEMSLEKRLKDLDELFDRGLITLDEYHERRKRIIHTI